MTELNRQPVYIQVLNDLRGKISRGELREGDPIPSERKLAEQWKISRTTATKVLGALRAEGLAESIQGTGTIVRAQKTLHRNGRDRAASVRRTGKIYTSGEYAKITSAEIVPAPADVAAALGLTADEPTAIKRVRVTYGPDDQPVSASISWYDSAAAEHAPKLLEAERIIEGSWGYLEKQIGEKAARGRDQISVRLATGEDAELLGLELPAAVKVSSTLLWTESGVVIEYGVSIAGPGRQSTYEYRLDEE